MVVDDVWDSAHGEQLAVVDPSSTSSKLLVTTRFSKLLEPCRVMMLGLMDGAEAKQLLLTSSGVVQRDDATVAAIDKIAVLCGNLPLLLTTVGRMISSYGNDSSWQAEVLAVLTEDRNVLLESGTTTDTSIVDHVLEASLR